ncbi:FAD-binding oxidoreductase [Marinibacterium profundimaris]|uniref:2-hydroxyacid dehydrogenase n=1 Tax=Marinibacterium profundimaris TaxID=1679460 RepID=A0A225NDT7_9RHOB|nr:FAD-binding oxidoreductase [Marinibacterium profundimaris]OWU70450.1 2-hydroxyacid dehydrogenase [Marinibacterium profundimaris]
MTLSPADAAFAERLDLPRDRLRPAETRYMEEPRGKYPGTPGLLALPHSTEEVAILITAAARAGVPVVPYGGGTGLVGGQVAQHGPAPLILSLERMDRIRAVYPEEFVLIAEAGAILADVQAAAQEADRLFPLSLAAEGSARIGGTLSTNAGGVNVLRYGSARDLCLGIEAVLPDGSILQGLRRLRKDNTGYDLRNLLVGAEGTLGIITAAALKLSPVPAGQGTAFLAVTDPQAALRLLSMARGRLGEAISAFELIHRQGMDFLAETLPQVRLPWDEPPTWSVLIEVGLAAGLDPEEALAGLFEAAFEAGLVTDGLIAQSAAQRDDFWNVRENIPEGNRLIGAVASHDISLPLSALPDFIAEADAAIAALGPYRINCFGHVGDGNLHYNIFPAPGQDRDEARKAAPEVTGLVHDLVARYEGSFSAEHGVGRAKVGDLERYGDPTKLMAMRAIKAALDPAGIMNPGAVLRG